MKGWRFDQHPNPTHSLFRFHSYHLLLIFLLILLVQPLSGMFYRNHLTRRWHFPVSSSSSFPTSSSSSSSARILLSPRTERNLPDSAVNVVPSHSPYSQHYRRSNRRWQELGANSTNFNTPDIRQATRPYCTCGDALLQTRYCKQDFVIIGRPEVQNSRPFYGLRATSLTPMWPFSGTIVPLTVQRSIKGNLQPGQRLEVYYAEGTMCGITEDMLPRKEGSYVISGFHVTIPGCRSLGSRCHLPPEIYLVTRCGWTAPLQELTITQIAGLFLGMYSCDEGTCQFLPSASGDATVGKPNACSYIYSATPCFSRYSLCVSVGQNDSKTGTCRLRAVKKIPLLSKTLQRIPRELHGKIFQAQTIRITDEDRFSACVAHSRV